MKASSDQRESVVAYIALGANLGDASDAILSAIAKIAMLEGVQVIAQSSLYRTAPVESSGADYINAVVRVITHSPAHALLTMLQKIEHDTGRQRPYLNAPRTLDLDILLYGNAKIDSDVLSVPHPRMWQRAFVLLPLQEIAPELVSSDDVLRVAGQRFEKIFNHQP